MSLLSWIIKSDFVRAQILATVRHTMTGLGAALIAHGVANDAMVQDLVGLALAATSFYLSQLDVIGVDKKITIALNTPSPSGTPDKEVTETALLNLQAKNGLASGKTP